MSTSFVELHESAHVVVVLVLAVVAAVTAAALVLRPTHQGTGNGGSTASTGPSAAARWSRSQ